MQMHQTKMELNNMQTCRRPPIKNDEIARFCSLQSQKEKGKNCDRKLMLD
jgi:hypothetical protein